MRKIIAAAFVSLDGVMQAPGGPEEDPTGGFAYGGWTAPYWDDVVDRATAENFGRSFDLLLGRKTYDIFAAHWPYVEADPAVSALKAADADISQSFGDATKYVASRSPPTLAWRNSQWLGADAVAGVRRLKGGDGPDLLTQGSSDLLQSLLATDLIDEIRLLTYPVVLGRGKRFFGEDAAAAAFRLDQTKVSPSGVIITSYVRGGEVRTGSFGLDEPSAAELERRRTWS